MKKGLLLDDAFRHSILIYNVAIPHNEKGITSENEYDSQPRRAGIGH